MFCDCNLVIFLLSDKLFFMFYNSFLTIHKIYVFFTISTHKHIIYNILRIKNWKLWIDNLIFYLNFFLFFCFLFTVYGLLFCDFVVLKLQNSKPQIGIFILFRIKNNWKIYSVSVYRFMMVLLLAVCLYLAWNLKKEYTSRMCIFVMITKKIVWHNT